jgi:hypothetical protein
VSSQAPARLGLWALLLLCLFVCAPGFAPLLWQSEQGFMTAWNVANPAALANVAVAPDIWRGLGIGALLPAQPLLLLGMAPARAVQWVLLSCLVLGALGLYAWLQGRLGDRAAGLAGSVYLLLPALLSTVFVRGSLGDALVLALLPLALAGVAVFATERAPLGAAVALLAIVWMVRTLAGLALGATLLLLLYALLVERSRLGVLLVAGGAAAALLSLIPAWSVRAAPPLAFDAQFTSLYGLLRTGVTDSAPLQIGTVALALSMAALVGLLALRSPVEGLAMSNRRLLIFSLSGAAILFALTLGWSAPLWRLTHADLLYSAPWQVGLLAAPLLAAAAGCALLYFTDLWSSAWYGAMALLLLLAAQPWLAPIYTQATPPERPVAILGDAQVAVLAAQVDESESDDGATRATLALDWQALAPLPFDANLFFQAVDVSGDSPRVVAQMDAPPVADRPATTWRQGDLFAQRYTLDLPADAPANMAYYMGLYNWQDGTRLRANGGLDDKLVLYGR